MRSGHSVNESACPQNLCSRPSPFGHAVRLVYRLVHDEEKRSARMIKVVIDTVLFCCMGAFVTGIVIVAANLLI